MPALFTTTDADGDTITIERNDEGFGFIAAITGEDGHRSVLLMEEDIERLARSLQRILNKTDVDA